MTPLSDGQEVRYLRTMIGRREAGDSGALAWHSPGRLLLAALVIASIACAVVAARSLMDLRLDQGAAAVSGPLLHDAKALRAGERMTIRLDQGKVILRQQEASERIPLEADISILRAFLAEQDISAATDAPEDLRGARLRRDPVHAAESDDPVALPATAPRPRPSRSR